MTVRTPIYSKLRPVGLRLPSQTLHRPKEELANRGRSLSDEASGSFRRLGEVGPLRVTRRETPGLRLPSQTLHRPKEELANRGRSLSDEASGSFRRPGEVGP
jgi:hypothetical protein